jgi:large subunit ribosomal protein L31
MKKDIHPEYAESRVNCACGAVHETRSTVKEMHVNTCASCHPFFTGQSKLLDTEGRVERFNKRYAGRAAK